MTIDTIMTILCFPFQLVIPIWVLCTIFKTDGMNNKPEDFEDDDFFKRADESKY